jgi:hypothetical protein
MKPRLDVGAGPIERCGRAAILGKRSGVGRRRMTLILGQRIEAQLLFVSERAVEFIEGRLDQIDGLLHRLDAQLHRRQPARRGRRGLRRAGGTDHPGRVDRGIAELVETCALRFGRLHRGGDLVDRQTHDLAPIAAAKLIQSNATRLPTS